MAAVQNDEKKEAQRDDGRIPGAAGASLLTPSSSFSGDDLELVPQTIFIHHDARPHNDDDERILFAPPSSIPPLTIGQQQRRRRRGQR